jgi:CRISPR-associated endonuclease/helicase Cas3
MTVSDLWPHQQYVSSMLAQGKNVILQSPTGSGKTRAALDHFLHQLGDQSAATAFPRRCIYSVPMRVLAKQFYVEYERIVKRYNLRFNLPTSVVVKTQTGEQPGSPELTDHLIFATIDQTLSSYLLSPYSLGRRKGNLNAGAVLSSYLVFDEFHLYDPQSTLPTTLMMLKTLKGITPFVLMTATFSEVMLQELGHLLNAEVFPQTAEQRAALENLPPQQKQRFYRLADSPLSARAVLQAHERRSLVICNTVDRARGLYDDLMRLAPADVEVILLHSRFLRAERDAIETRIHGLFGKEADRTTGSAIVVATQAIEVGVDMSCTALHTELAPANAIVQRAGRCARYTGDVGTVYLYTHTINPDDLETSLDLTDPNNAAPYVSQAALFAATLDAFRARAGEDAFSFSDEQGIITEVHNEEDRATLETIRASGRTFAAQVYAVQRGDQREDARHLIREIQQQNIIIHADPDSLLSLPHVTPLLLPAFGLHPGTLQKYVRRWLEIADAQNTWAVKILHDYGLKKDEADESAMQTNEERYRWHEVKTMADARFALLTVVNPLLATYDLRRGFVPDQGGDWQTPIPEPKDTPAPKGGYTYRLETYTEHIRQVYTAFLHQWWESAWAAQQLERRFGWQPGAVRRAAELAVLLHDVGKLSVGWQKWVQDYQNSINAEEDDSSLEPQAGEAYAHTHLQTDRHREIARKTGKRPWHAVEGAVSAAPVLAAALEDEPLVCAAFAAIARHHAPYSDSHQPYRLVREARRHIAATFPNTLPLPDLHDLTESAEKEDPHQLIPNPDGDVAAFLTYLLLVRTLRRADTAGTEAGRLRF